MRSGVARRPANRHTPLCVGSRSGTRAPSLHRHYPVSPVLRAPPPSDRTRRPSRRVEGSRSPPLRSDFPCCAPFLVSMPPPKTPVERTGLSSDESTGPFQPSPRPQRVGLGHVAFGAVLAFTRVAACSLADGPRPPFPPRLRPLRCLRNRWECYPAGTTVTGAGLPPAGTAHLCTAHGDIRLYFCSSESVAPDLPCIDARHSAGVPPLIW